MRNPDLYYYWKKQLQTIGEAKLYSRKSLDELQNCRASADNVRYLQAFYGQTDHYNELSRQWNHASRMIQFFERQV